MILHKTSTKPYCQPLQTLDIVDESLANRLAKLYLRDLFQEIVTSTFRENFVPFTIECSRGIEGSLEVMALVFQKMCDTCVNLILEKLIKIISELRVKITDMENEMSYMTVGILSQFCKNINLTDLVEPLMQKEFYNMQIRNAKIKLQLAIDSNNECMAK